MTDTVLCAYLHPGEVSHSFHQSLVSLINYDIGHEGRIVRAGGPVMFRCGTGGLIEARNDVVRHFLDRTDADWLWCIDADMGFAPDTVDRLLDAADPVERPVVGALCFALRELSPDGMGGMTSIPRPTIYQWAQKRDGEHGFIGVADYPANTLMRVAGTGAACLLVHRSIAAKIRDLEAGDVWFDRVVYPKSGTRVAEDLSFCWRVNRVDAPVYVHTGIRTTHRKAVYVSEADYLRRFTATPATDQTAVLVPVMRRPENAALFVASLRASTGLASVYAIAHHGDEDTIAAWWAAGAEVIAGDEHGFAAKVNRGYLETSEPWIFIVGDDVRFHPGWLDHAQHVAHSYDAKVIGTNDLGNPRVLAGEHATHLLIDRVYVNQRGASWDGPGVVCHEGYEHCFVDDEIVAVAKQRDVWAMALGSIVEHLHPLWGKASDDDVYQRGRSSFQADRRRFVGRCGSYKHQEATVAAG